MTNALDLQRQAPGAYLRATVPITERLLNMLVAPVGLRIMVGVGNELRIEYNVLSFSARIVGIEPDLTILLSTSWLNRKLLGGALAMKPELKRFVHVDSVGSIRIPCGRFSAVERYRKYWQHVSRVNVRSEVGRLFLDIDARVRER